ncbi:MAG: hypothetical protein ACPIOQ_20865, partial [Promethearchaeia archaeon]
APKAKWRGNTAKTRFLGNKDYVSECEAACLAYTARGGVECKSFVWFDEPPKLCMMASSCWALQCHAVITDDWAPVPDEARAAVSGHRGIAATSMLNKLMTSVADGVMAAVNATMSYTQLVALATLEQKAAAAAKTDRERTCKTSGSKGCEWWYSAVRACAPQGFPDFFAVSVKLSPLDALTNLPVAAGILSLFFLVTVIATLVMVADDTPSTDASSIPAACAPVAATVVSLFGVPAKKEEAQAATPTPSFPLSGAPAKRVENKEKKTPSAAAAVWFGFPTSHTPPQADQGLSCIELPELPDGSRLDELIPGNDNESSESKLRVRLRRLQDARNAVSDWASQHHAEIQPLLAELSELMRLEELDGASPPADGTGKAQPSFRKHPSSVSQCKERPCDFR